MNIPYKDIVAVVPAAGVGSRMQAECPKQYLLIGEQTILEHSITSLMTNTRIAQVIVAINPYDTYFSSLPLAHHPAIRTVKGGESRAESVLAGLKAVTGAKWVLVHDAARPCLHQDDLNRLLALTDTSEIGGILACPVRDTMKRGESHHSRIAHTVDRESLWHALTPQLFPLELLCYCLERAINEGATITDEASALEYCGYHPELVNARSDNIKVTRPEDLALAEFYLMRLNQTENM